MVTGLTPRSRLGQRRPVRWRSSDWSQLRDEDECLTEEGQTRQELPPSPLSWPVRLSWDSRRSWIPRSSPSLRSLVRPRRGPSDPHLIPRKVGISADM